MEKLELISLERINEMGESSLRAQIGKCKRVLTDTYGLSEDDADTLIVNVVRLGIAIQNKQHN